MSSAHLGTMYQVRDERRGAESDLPLLSVSQIYGVVPRSELMGDEGRSAGLANYKICRPGDVVINRMSAYNGAIGVATQPGVVSPDYLVIAPRAGADSRFITYWLKSHWGQYEIVSRLRGIGSPGTAQVRTPRVNETDLRRIPGPFPKSHEQQAIADYLGRETRRIDELIAEQRGLIETLRERRRAVIDDSLDGSGEWEVVPLKHLIERVEQGVSPQAGSVPAHGEEWGVLKSGCVNRGVFRESENKRLPEDFGIDESLAVRVGDVLVSRASGSVDFVGSCARVRSLGCKLILSDKIFRLVPRQRVDAGFLVWLLNSRLYREQVRLAVSGAQGLANNLPLSSLRTFAFHVPVNVDEQRVIATNLDDQTSRIDTLIAESEDLIALSLERRAALITAAVTGQIDVRTAV